MNQNNKKPALTRMRWAQITEFLYSNLGAIQELLHSSICPEMMRTDVYLENSADGILKLSAHVVKTGKPNRLLVWSINRTAEYDLKRMKREIEGITMAVH